VILTWRPQCASFRDLEKPLRAARSQGWGMSLRYRPLAHTPRGVGFATLIPKNMFFYQALCVLLEIARAVCKIQCGRFSVPDCSVWPRYRILPVFSDMGSKGRLLCAVAVRD
jgi:hypothetical protein